MTSPIRVLIVDDNAAFRHGLALLLKMVPDFMIVGEAANGAEAISECHRVQPTLILMDLLMPGLSGVEATRAIHRLYPDIPIVGLSGFESAEQCRTIVDAGAVICISKNMPPSDFIMLFRAVVEKAAIARFGTSRTGQVTS